MALTGPFVLHPDVVISPVAELPAELRAQLKCDDGDFAISRPRARTTSKVLNADAARLVEEFRMPSTIVDAIIRHSRASNANPHEVLEEAYPLLGQLARYGLLVPPGSEQAAPVTQVFEEGTSVVGHEVIRCLQVLEDTELYQVRASGGDIAVLKVLRPGASHTTRLLHAQEKSILGALDGKVNPALLGSGTIDDRPYLLIGWCPGVQVLEAAEELRQQSREAGSEGLLALCCSVADAYAHLHSQQVIHGDVHPRNLLVDAGGHAWIIDYGFSRHVGGDNILPTSGRGGVSFFFEPEFAQAALDDDRPPACSMAGEQYAVAALLYQTFTGSQHQEFALERSALMRQIVHDPPLTFKQVGAQANPGVEAVLRRALSKQPKERYPSMAAFAEALHLAGHDASAANPAAPAQRQAPSAAQRLLTDVLERVEPAGELFVSGLPVAPKCSVNAGAAGIALALYRLASIQESPRLLSLADVWITRALRDSDADDAFNNAGLEATPETLGRISPNHTLSGLYCVQALISHAMGDALGQQAALHAAVDAWDLPCENLDLTLGRSSTLLAGSLLLDTAAGQPLVDARPLKEHGQKVLQGIWEELDAQSPIGESAALPNLGMAHGWAGFLYAAMRWCRSAGCEPPAAVGERLEQLAALAEPVGRGARWKWSLERPGPGVPFQYMAGWCNGSAGHTFLWVLAHQMFGDERTLRLAEMAAWNAWEDPPGIKDLCCGLAGRAYALLSLYRLTGQREWLLRARQLADRAVGAPAAPEMPAHSLYKGDLGVAVLAADLDHPESAAMPFFEAEGWTG
jgi:serine/threonine protein kinase